MQQKVIYTKAVSLDKRHKLIDALKNANVFWSYNTNNIEVIPDEILIEKVLIHLDLGEISMLFKLFPEKQIKQVWEKQILTQEPYYHNLNKFIAWFYFNKDID
jgi:hypothetical protein